MPWTCWTFRGSPWCWRKQSSSIWGGRPDALWGCAGGNIFRNTQSNIHTNIYRNMPDALLGCAERNILRNTQINIHSNMTCDWTDSNISRNTMRIRKYFLLEMFIDLWHVAPRGENLRQGLQMHGLANDTKVHHGVLFIEYKFHLLTFVGRMEEK